MRWLKEKMEGQDNRATSHPVYFVQEYVEKRDTISDVICSYYQNIQPFFSNKGAEEFIEMNEHNLNAPRIYVASGYNNPEWKAIRAAILGDGRE